MNYARHLHQSLLLEEKFLFVFFGKKSLFEYNNTIEFLDMTARHK